MRQFLLGWIAFAVLLAWQPGTSLVYGQAPAAKVDPNALAAGEAFLQRVEGVEFSLPVLFKLLTLVLLFLMWVRAGDWINKDSQIHGLGYWKWNPIVFFPFAILGLVFFFVPIATFIRAPILLVVFLATVIPYVVVHNKSVEPHETVLTGPWWRYVFVSFASKLGIKVSAERKAEYEKGAPVELLAMGAKDLNENNANLLSARLSPGYLLVKDMIVEIVSRRSERMLLDFTKQAVKVRHEIDGVWHNGEARDRESGDVMLAVMKTLSNLEIRERRKKQTGQFGVKYEGKTYCCPITSQGVASGERVLITLQGEKQQFDSYDDLGMREGLQQQWTEMMASDQGLVILATLPGGGLTTITDVSLNETDRLMRDFVAIEEVNHREKEIQNVGATTYDASAGETPATVLPTLIRTYPNVYVLRDFSDIEAVKLLFNEIRDEHLVITSVRAREANEALLRLLQMKVPAKEFAATVKAVLYQRLIRLLCSDCKVGYTPPPDVLRKLGIPKGKVEQLYRPPKPEEIEKPCPTCQGVGYKGRTGVFELLVVSDSMREILAKSPKIDLLKKAARAARQRSLQEEGIVLVAQGATSLPELMRVLKG